MRQNMFYSALLLTLANLLLRTVSMVFQVYLSNLVGAAGIGLLQLILMVGVMAMTVGTSGVRIAGMYLCAEEFGHRRPGGVRRAMTLCLGYALVISTLAGLALIRTADAIALGWIGDARAASSLRLTGLFLPFTCLSAVMSGYFTAAGKVGRLVLVEILERAMSIPLTIVLLTSWAGSDTERACCAIIGGSSVATAICFFLLYFLYLLDRRGMRPTGERLRLPQRLAKLCLPLAFNEYLRSGLGTLEHMLIPRGLARAGDSHENSMAAYGTIHGMVFPIIFFPTSVLYSISDLLVPELAKCTASRNQLRIRHLTDKCLRLGFLYAAAVGGGLYVLSARLGELIYRSEEVGLYIRIFAPLVLMLYLDAIVDGMNKGLGQQVRCVRYNTFTSTLDVILLWVLLPRYGIGGYFFSYTVTHLINFFLSVRRLLQVSGYRLPLAFLLKVLICTLLACGVAGGTAGGIGTLGPLATALAQAVLFLILFSGLAYLCAALSRDDLRWLRSVILPRHRRRARP